MADLRMPGFEYRGVNCNEVTLNVAVAGHGPPLLLLHGFPETHLAWREVAPRLARQHRVVCPDLRGYGDSDKPRGDPRHDQYSKRTMARDVISLMTKLGASRFSVVGHDRGGLVAFRAALDQPRAVERLAVLDVIPAADMWQSLAGVAGVFAFHLYFLAQQADFPERLIAASPDTFFGQFLDAWTKVEGAIPAPVRRRYLDACGTAQAIHAVCEDYRASAFVDPAQDEEDRRAGRRLNMPVLAMWQDPGEQTLPFDPRKIWGSWASNLQTKVLPCGHFLPEEQPAEVAEALESFLCT
jgi:pimeloyl-ACP methyl ester carboxylesterase